MSGHTPGPWAVTKGKPRKVTANGVLICTAVLRNRATTKQNAAGKGEEEARANAAFIVRARNSHDALLEALDFMTNVARSMSGFSPMAMKQAVDAIAAATGEVA